MIVEGKEVERKERKGIKGKERKIKEISYITLLSTDVSKPQFREHRTWFSQ